MTPLYEDAECYQCAQIQIHHPRCPYRLRDGRLTVDKHDVRAPRSPIALCDECGNFNIHRKDCQSHDPAHRRVETKHGVLTGRGPLNDADIGTRLTPGVPL